jgi:hypothetical protein
LQPRDRWKADGAGDGSSGGHRRFKNAAARNFFAFICLGMFLISHSLARLSQLFGNVSQPLILWIMDFGQTFI